MWDFFLLLFRGSSECPLLAVYQVTLIQNNQYAIVVHFEGFPLAPMIGTHCPEK